MRKKYVLFLFILTLFTTSCSFLNLSNNNYKVEYLGQHGDSIYFLSTFSEHTGFHNTMYNQKVIKVNDSDSEVIYDITSFEPLIEYYLESGYLFKNTYNDRKEKTYEMVNLNKGTLSILEFDSTITDTSDIELQNEKNVLTEPFFTKVNSDKITYYKIFDNMVSKYLEINLNEINLTEEYTKYIFSNPVVTSLGYFIEISNPPNGEKFYLNIGTNGDILNRKYYSNPYNLHLSTYLQYDGTQTHYMSEDIIYSFTDENTDDIKRLYKIAYNETDKYYSTTVLATYSETTFASRQRNTLYVYSCTDGNKTNCKGTDIINENNIELIYKKEKSKNGEGSYYRYQYDNYVKCTYTKDSFNFEITDVNGNHLISHNF